MAILWMVAFAVLVLIELQTMEFTCLSLAMGCLLAASGAWLGLGVGLQILIAALGGGGCVLLLAPALRRRVLPQDTRTGNDLLVGADAVVVEAIQPPNEGKVKLDGVVWQAVSDRPIPEGAHVFVMELQGAKLAVMAKNEIEAGRRASAEPEGVQRPEAQREHP